jgi:Rho-binding antiterminator
MSYKPIDCDYYDELALMATKRKKVEIKYKEDDGADQRTEGVISTMETRDHEEFLILENGSEIRLDRLIEVDGKPLPQ